MHYRDVRRLLRDIERADDRWRLHEAWLASGSDDWLAVVDDADTGRWHVLDAYTDLVVARPALPPGRPPAAVLATLPPPHPAGALTWGEWAIGSTARPTGRGCAMGPARCLADPSPADRSPRPVRRRPVGSGP